MRRLILKRIEELKAVSDNFNRNTMRWKSPLSHGTENKYADEIDFESLNDTELLLLFERLIRRMSKIM